MPVHPGSDLQWLRTKMIAFVSLPAVCQTESREGDKTIPRAVPLSRKGREHVYPGHLIAGSVYELEVGTEGSRPVVAGVSCDTRFVYYEYEYSSSIQQQQYWCTLYKDRGMGRYVFTCSKYAFFQHWRPLLFRPRVFLRALGCGVRRGAACTLGASLAHGRASWRVLWAFKVARSDK